ncbi:MAG TPA: hypothetical protein DIW47_07970 [Bacteroidetes bacterium]|nr:hypothetical protein [Bacteroidota bacterium]
MFVACLNNDKVQVVTIDNRYSLTIPAFLKEVSNLNEDASLQYQHAMKEFYVVVIDEPKAELQKALEDNGLNSLYSDDVDGFANLLIDGMDDAITITKKSDVIDTVVNSMPARMIQIHGEIEGINAFYSVAYIEGKETYYQVMTWTLASKEKKNREKMDKLLYTLKEL